LTTITGEKEGKSWNSGIQEKRDKKKAYGVQKDSEKKEQRYAKGHHVRKGGKQGVEKSKSLSNYEEQRRYLIRRTQHTNIKKVRLGPKKKRTSDSYR